MVTSTSNPLRRPFLATRRSEFRPSRSTARILSRVPANRGAAASRGFRLAGYASVRGENMRSGFLQQCDDLFALHARKTFKKLLDRISCFQMIEEALRRHPRARKHWLASEHLGILRNDAAHAANVKIKMNRKPAGCIRPFPSSVILPTFVGCFRMVKTCPPADGLVPWRAGGS